MTDQSGSGCFRGAGVSDPCVLEEFSGLHGFAAEVSDGSEDGMVRGTVTVKSVTVFTVTAISVMVLPFWILRCRQDTIIFS